MTLAYIDPGSGSMFVQIVIATLLAAPFLVREQIKRLAERLGNLRQDKK